MEDASNSTIIRILGKHSFGLKVHKHERVNHFYSTNKILKVTKMKLPEGLQNSQKGFAFF